MKKRRNRSDSSAWMALPLYIFTIVFVVCPLIYMVALSFATPSRGFGVTWKFTLDKDVYKRQASGGGRCDFGLDTCTVPALCLRSGEI